MNRDSTIKTANGENSAKQDRGVAERIADKKRPSEPVILHTGQGPPTLGVAAFP
jgi:hypothetical protein